MLIQCEPLRTASGLVKSESAKCTLETEAFCLTSHNPHVQH